MSSQPTKPIDVFYSYAHEDEKLRDELKKHLANLKRQGVITEWYDRDISAGKEWAEEINKHLETASVILLLISPDFMNSDYSNDVEVKRAMERHEVGEARVIPIILRPVDWEGAPFSKLQGLPTDAKAVTLWENYDEAFLSVVQGIRSALKESRRTINVHSRTNIPRPPVVGFVARRDSEGRNIIERLTEELTPQKNQLIALNGPGGVGKTTLAAEAARALSNRVGDRIVWTSALGREDFALPTMLDEIATQLDHAELRPLSLERKTAEVQLLVASAPTLIILDNFETIAEVEQTRCLEFLSNRASCPVLITTRGKIAAARNISIPVMSPEEANTFLELLIEQSNNPSAFTQIDRNRIVAASERNPLVLQWVIGQIELAQEANTVLDELAQGTGDAAQRVFDRSFGLEQLGDDGRAALLALSLFAPDASRAALAAVAGFDLDLKRLNEAVKRLAGLWFIKASATGSRLSVAGLTRELAKARLSRDGSAKQYRQRFIAHFADYVEGRSQRTPEDYDSLEVEKDNLIIATDLAASLADWESVLGIATVVAAPVTGVLAIRGYWNDSVKLNTQALEAARRSKPEAAVAGHMHNLAMMLESRGELDEARQLYNDSLEISRKLGDQRGIAIRLHQMANLAYSQGELDEARRLYNESLVINKKLGEQDVVSLSLHQLAMLAHHQGELDEARRLYNESLATSQQLDNQNSIALTLHQLAILAQDQGEVDNARRLYMESLEISKKLGNQGGISPTLHQLATLAHAQGKLDEARLLYNESLATSQKLGNQISIALSLHQLAMLAQDQGEVDEARRLYMESLDINKKLGNQDGISLTLHQLAILAQEEGEFEESRRLYNESLGIKKKLGNQNGIGVSLAQLGMLAEDEGNNAEAEQLLAEALVIFERLKSPNAEIARRELERIKNRSS